MFASVWCPCHSPGGGRLENSVAEFDAYEMTSSADVLFDSCLQLYIASTRTIFENIRTGRVTLKQHLRWLVNSKFSFSIFLNCPCSMLQLYGAPTQRVSLKVRVGWVQKLEMTKT